MEVIFKYIGFALMFVFLGIIGVGVFFFYIVKGCWNRGKCWRLKRMIGAMCRVNVHEILRFALNDKHEATEYALMVEW